MARRRKRLKKRLFYGRKPKPYFGLRNGQLRAGSVRAVKNAGWYNHLGEKIGWGDLSMADMRRIAQSLRRGELFILLSETDSFWKHVTTFRGGVGSQCETSPKEMAPGLEFVAERCTHVIAPRRIHVVERWDDGRRPSSHEIDGVACRIIGQDDVDTLIPRRRTAKAP